MSNPSREAATMVYEPINACEPIHTKSAPSDTTIIREKAYREGYLHGQTQAERDFEVVANRLSDRSKGNSIGATLLGIAVMAFIGSAGIGGFLYLQNRINTLSPLRDTNSEPFTNEFSTDFEGSNQLPNVLNEGTRPNGTDFSPSIPTPESNANGASPDSNPFAPSLNSDVEGKAETATPEEIAPGGEQSSARQNDTSGAEAMGQSAEQSQ
jgi:hypothetical protein